MFNEIVEKNGSPFNIKNFSDRYWHNVALGTSAAHISIDLNNRKSNIVVQVYISNNKKIFDKLFERKEDIEKELFFELVWNCLDNAKASRIKSFVYSLNFDDHSNYSELTEEIVDCVVVMKRVFSSYIKQPVL